MIISRARASLHLPQKQILCHYCALLRPLTREPNSAVSGWGGSWYTDDFDVYYFKFLNIFNWLICLHGVKMRIQSIYMYSLPKSYSELRSRGRAVSQWNAETKRKTGRSSWYTLVVHSLHKACPQSTPGTEDTGMNNTKSLPLWSWVCLVEHKYSKYMSFVISL